MIFRQTRRGFLALLPAALLAQSRRKLVLMDHDGGTPDDFLAAALLLTMDHIQTIGIVVTPGDGYLAPSVSATRKLLDLMGHSEIPVAASAARGLNPFPHEWRKISYNMDQAPVLNERPTIRAPLAAETGQKFIVRMLREAREPVTLLVTGPLTTVADALDISPEIERKIAEIVWMGGALNVKGNVAPDMEPGHDGSAEWNAYWDPPAVARVWQSKIPIVMCPLDITNTVPVTPAFLRQLGSQRRYPLSELAAQSYAFTTLGDYFFWDLLTTAYLGRPEIFKLREWETAIVTDGASQGRTKVQAGGRKVRALDKVDLDQFYPYVLKQWSR